MTDSKEATKLVGLSTSSEVSRATRNGSSSDSMLDIVLRSLSDQARSSDARVHHIIGTNYSSRNQLKFLSKEVPFVHDDSSTADEGLVKYRMKQIAGSGIFDVDHYLTQVSSIGDTDPIEHFLRRGWIEGLDPHPLFSVNYYLEQYPDVRHAGIDPLTHYIERGSTEMRNPHPLFLSYYYGVSLGLDTASESTLLLTFLRQKSTVSPHPIFDLSEYGRRVGVAFPDASSAILSYLQLGWKQGFDVSPFFRSSFYRDNIGHEHAKIEPYTHYAIFGVPRWMDPHPLFDVPRYRSLAGDVDGLLDPLVHYVWKGEKAGLSPCSLFDLSLSRRSAEAHFPAKGAFWQYLTSTKDEQSSAPSGFPVDRYRETSLLSSDIQSSETAIEHFRRTGVFRLDRESIDLLEKPITRIEPEPTPVLPSAPSAADVAPWREYPGKTAFRRGLPNVLLVAHAAAEHLFGSERSFLDMLDALTELPINVYVALPRNVPDYTNAIRPKCVRVFIVKYDWWRKGVDVSDAAIDAFSRILDAHAIDLVHANTIMLRECLLAARLRGIPGAVHVRELISQDIDLVNLIGLTVEQIVQEVKARADWIIGNSDKTANTFLKKDMTFVIRNMSDIVPVPGPPSGVASTKIRFGLISSNIPKKGVFDLAKVAKICQDLAPTAEFLMIGPETESVISIRGSLSDEDRNLVFPGYAASPQQALTMCDVVLNLSHFAESFGRTVLEAMICGKPVIAYDWGALDELIIHGETGYLIPHRDINAAATAVKILCDNPDLIQLMGQRGRAIADKLFGRSAYVKAFTAAYQDMLPVHLRNVGDEGSTPFVRKARRSELFDHESQPRIAYFCWHFPVPSETFILNELRVLRQRNVDVIVFCRQTPFKDFSPDFDISYERVSSAEQLATRLRETARTVVHAHFTYPTVTNMVWPACEAAGIPFTFTAHAQDIFVYKNDQLNRLADIGASPLCLRMFTLSKFHFNFVVSRGFPAEKTIINPNAISVDLFAGADRRSWGGAGHRRVVAIHRFVPKKGLENLIRAAPLVQDLGVQIEIYGYGDLEASYRELVASESISNVKICGRLTQQEIPSVLNDASLFACPSVRTAEGDMDGIPTSIIESMAAGVPVLTTSIAGIADLVEDGISGIVCEGTPESIAAAIRRFYGLPDLQVRSMTVEAHRRVAAMHDAAVTVGTMLRVWRNDVIDIVIVSWNNLQELKMVVDAVRRNTVLPYHLIICDNMSRREAVARYLDILWCQDERVTIIHNNSNAMVGPGTNLAMEHGKGDFIIYVCGKEGMSFANAWEGSLIRDFSAEDVGLVGTIGYSPTYLYGDQYRSGISLFDKFRAKQFALDNPDREFGHIQGGLFAMRRSMIDEIGGFSMEVPHDYTDVEYSLYAESRGWRLKASEGTLALFNKSRPTLSQRFREDIKVAHPVLPDQIEKLTDIVAGRVRHCNICDWFGQSDRLHFVCHECGSSAMDRSLFRWLSDGNLLFRRLPALAVGLEGRMREVWLEQFQGPNIDLTSWDDTLIKAGRLPNVAKKMNVAIFRTPTLSREKIVMYASEAYRLLKPRGILCVQVQTEHTDEFFLQEELWTGAMGEKGKIEHKHLQFASRAIGYSYVPMIIARRLH